MTNIIKELKRLHAAATPGKWFLDDLGDKETPIYTKCLDGEESHLNEPIAYVPHDDTTEQSWPEVEANMTWIPAIHNAFPALIARLEAAERLRGAVGRLNNQIGSDALDNALAAFDKEQP